MTQVFSIQDRTGTVVQVTLEDAPSEAVAVNDTGTYTGVQDWNGETVSFNFTVCQVLDTTQFSITTALPGGSGPGNIMQSGWPLTGNIKWLTGANALPSPADDSVVTQIDPANAYITTDFLAAYNNSRGTFIYSDSPILQVQQAIVQASEYLDQRYRFKGVKFLQFLDTNIFDPNLPFLDPWFSPFGYSAATNLFTPSFTDQWTEWPRQGCVDFNGDSVYGVPLVIQRATAELALRALNGVMLQPDYDPNVVTAGAIVSSLSQQVGPLKTTTTYDTKLGIGFFPDFPHVTRMLTKAGLLVASGGMSLIR